MRFINFCIVFHGFCNCVSIFACVSIRVYLCWQCASCAGLVNGACLFASNVNSCLFLNRVRSCLISNCISCLFVSIRVYLLRVYSCLFVSIVVCLAWLLASDALSKTVPPRRLLCKNDYCIALHSFDVVRVYSCPFVSILVVSIRV